MADAASLFILGSFVAACTAKVERLPAAGESLSATDFALEPGGKGLNIAIGARRLGAAVDGLFAIGDDNLAELAEPAFRRADLSTTMLRRRAGPTGAGVGFIASDGETCLAVRPGANGTLSCDDVMATRATVERAAVVVAQFEIPDEPIAEAFKLARSVGGTTLLTPSPFRPTPPEMLQATSILIVNVVEAASLADFLGLRAEEGEAHQALAEALFAHGPETLVITLGRRGAVLFRKGEPALTQPAFEVSAVDTLGAGDAFAAGFAVSLAEGLDYPESLERACACGALVAQTYGVFDALPTRSALDVFLGSRP